MPGETFRTEDRLATILEVIDLIERKLQNTTLGQFVVNANLIDATALRLGTIGENCRKLPDDLKERHPDIPWPQIYGLRNIVFHEYKRVLPSELWNAAKDGLDDIAAMCREELQRIMDQEREAQDRGLGPKR